MNRMKTSSTSFKKKQRVAGGTPRLPGTQPSLHNGQLLCSTGVPSLDAVIGGGIAVGTVFLLEQDENCQYSNVLTRYFLAEGVVSGHDLLVVSFGEESSLVNHLPEPITLNEDPETTQAGGDMRIAWRYQNTPKVQTSVAQKSKYGHYYDITKIMDETRLKNCKISCIDLKKAYCDGTLEPSFDIFKYTLKELRKFVIENYFDISSAVKCEKPMNILRVVIPGFGGPLWGHEMNRIVQFLICLRTIARNSLIVCFITAPTRIYPHSSVQLVRHSMDTAIKLDAFGEEKMNPLYKEYHGLLKIEKLSALNSLAPFMPDTLDLAFKLRRKKFSVERLHLPPDVGEPPSRDDAKHPQSMCGSSGGSMDF